ncbi:hypothetical protein [Streptomyces sp. NPDC051567]|uniref:hypothetical protein n=1 Tax=Streptomyces sp. NPDC051567 TaxID=3365660 RepID=UPI0037AA0D01
MSRSLAVRVSGVVLVLAAMVAGCSEKKTPAASKLPSGTCFGVFDPADLAPLLGDGEEVKVVAPADMTLTPARPSAICNVYVDRQGPFLATVERAPVGRQFFWPLDKANPDPLPFVENGKVWNTGAAVALTCKKAEESFELELWISGSSNKMKYEDVRPLFTALMKKYLEAARQQNGCGS